MRLDIPRLSSTGFAAAFGAGLASAFLSMLTAQNTTLALAMGSLAPLPIMIAAIGFGSAAGLIAAIAGAIAIGALDLHPTGLVLADFQKLGPIGFDVLVFSMSVGVPSWLLARAAVRSVGDTNASLRRGLPVRPEERVLGTIVAVAVAFAAASVVLDFVVATVGKGGFDAFMKSATERLEPIVQSLLASRGPLPKGFNVNDFALVLTWVELPLAAAGEVVLLVFNLWLAARIAQTSSLLSAPWPDIPRYMRVPRPLAIVLAVALGLSFAGGLVGMLSLIVCGALLMSFALQGFAVIHATTRGKSFRLPLLIIVYFTFMLLIPWSIFPYGFLGLLDSGFAFRDREKITVKQL